METQIKKTEILSPEFGGIARAARIIADGGLVAFPTETVYGLGADACNGAAVAGIFTAKNRPPHNPLIVHIAGVEAAESFARFDNVAKELAMRFWPGPLSLVLPLRDSAGVSDLVCAGLKTVAIRAPAHPLARDLLAELTALRGAPVGIAAPSANPSGRMSPTRPMHVRDGLGGKIDAIIDGGACAVGLESTIVYPRADGAVIILRAGGVSAAQIAEAVGQEPIIGQKDSAPILSPGQLASHYAPRAPLAIGVEAPNANQLYLGFGEFARKQAGDLNLSPSADLAEAAHNLFDYLYRLDSQAQSSGKSIAVAPIPNCGLGISINDRLSRACLSV